MSFRKLFKKLCIFGSAASLALGIFSGAAFAKAPTASVTGKLYGTLNADSGTFTGNTVSFRDANIRLLPTLPLNPSPTINGGTYGNCVLDVTGMGNNTANVTVTPYAWTESQNKYVAGTLEGAARGVAVYVRAQKHPANSEDTSSTNTGWFKVAAQDDQNGSIYNISNSNNSGEGANQLTVNAVGKWDVYFFVDGGDTYVDTDEWARDW